MSMNTWSQYVSMNDPELDPARVATALEMDQDWDDDFELGASWSAEELVSEEY